MQSTINSNLLPSEVDYSPWLHELKLNAPKNYDTGKWMLFYNKKDMDDKWNLAKKLFRENKLPGVVSMKCSTNYSNPRASNSKDGIIILYCSDSSNEEKIMEIGKNIIEMFDYKKYKTLYYKTDVQTQQGTKATGIKKNHSYKLINPLYVK